MRHLQSGRHLFEGRSKKASAQSQPPTRTKHRTLEILYCESSLIRWAICPVVWNPAAVWLMKPGSSPTLFLSVIGQHHLAKFMLLSAGRSWNVGFAPRHATGEERVVASHLLSHFWQVLGLAVSAKLRSWGG